MDIATIVSSPVTWVVTIASTVYILYKYGTANFDYFRVQGIPGPKPLPYFGNMWGIWKANIPKYDQELVKKYGRVIGYFDGTVPNLFTTDAELIRLVFVKDFDHFINRRNFEIKSKVIRKMITVMKNQEWKDVRSSLTPAFTTGKIKRMSTMIKESSDQLVEKFKIIAEKEGKLDAKIHLSTFTMEVIAKCAFGMTIDRLGEKDDPFMQKARELMNPKVNKSPFILMPFLFPKLASIMGESMFFGQFVFFIKFLEDMIKQRSANPSIKYHDFIEVATEAIREYTQEVNGKTESMFDREEVDEIVISQSLIFLLAGFDTTATTLTNTIFLLSRNSEIQEKLYDQLSTRLEKHGEVSHEMVLDFPYLDHVLHEVLRFYPPVLRVERACNKDVVYKGISIRSGTLVTVPAFALHYDEEYYPEPHVFNPDRWDPESAVKPNPYVFMPFGMGPRNCIGMRFAMEEMKIALCVLLKSLRFFPVAETPEKMEFQDGFLGVTQPIHATVGVELRSQY